MSTRSPEPVAGETFADGSYLNPDGHRIKQDRVVCRRCGSRRAGVGCTASAQSNWSPFNRRLLAAAGRRLGSGISDRLMSQPTWSRSPTPL